MAASVSAQSTPGSADPGGAPVNRPFGPSSLHPIIADAHRSEAWTRATRYALVPTVVLPIRSQPTLCPSRLSPPGFETCDHWSGAADGRDTNVHSSLPSFLRQHNQADRLHRPMFEVEPRGGPALTSANLAFVRTSSIQYPAATDPPRPTTGP